MVDKSSHTHHLLIKFLGALTLVSLVSACTLPRGAAIQSEITQSQDAEDATFAVEPVTQDSVARLATWPATGWEGHYHWFSSPRGPADSRIQTGDVLNLTIWDTQENSLVTNAGEKRANVNALEVSPSGEVFVPYIGEVRVAGLSPISARKYIQKEMEMIAPSAQVQLQMVAGPVNTVDVVGGVANPGSYPLPNRNYSLLSLLAKAGGIDKSLRNPLVRLIRNGKTYEIPADALFEDASKNVVLRGKDQVIVVKDERYFIALGAAGSEQQVFFAQERISALESISLIGGLNDARANPKGILILREYPAAALRTDGTGPSKQQTIFTLDLTSAEGLFAARNFQINPNDSVLATESPVNSVRTIFGLIGSAFGLVNAANGG